MIQLIPSINLTASALNAERIRMDVVSQNIANANLDRNLDGRPYQRQRVVFESVLQAQGPFPASPGTTGPEVRVARIEADPRPPRQVYDPDRGFVPVPDISVHEELVDLIASSRAFEANLAVIKNARAMATQALSIGKR